MFLSASILSFLSGNVTCRQRGNPVKIRRISPISSCAALPIDLQLLQVDADPLVEIELAVVQQSPRGIGVPIDDGDPVDAQAFEPHRGKKPRRAGSDDQYVVCAHNPLPHDGTAAAALHIGKFLWYVNGADRGMNRLTCRSKSVV